MPSPKKIKLYKKKSLWVSNRHDEGLQLLEQLTDLKQSEHMRRALDDYFKKMKAEGIM